MYTLYYSPDTASMVVHLALLEIGAPYKLELVRIRGRTTIIFESFENFENKCGASPSNPIIFCREITPVVLRAI